jgi:LacI family transcriptional regulator
MAKKTTLRDIAQQANVALSTVSQVLNNKPNVSPETRQIVLEAAAALGYQQKIAVDAPVVPRLASVGLLAKRRENDPITLNPFYSYIIAGTERECQRQNITLMFASVDVDAEYRAAQLPVMLLNDQLDGVIIVGTFIQDTVTDISRRVGRNVVLVDAYMDGEPLFDSILSDNFSGTMQAVSYLIANGHRHIGLIGSYPQSFPSIYERRYAYFAALERHGITDTYVEDSSAQPEDAFDATLRLMERAPQITALFACNDSSAFASIQALKQLGLSVPGDVSVIGFDDIDPPQADLLPLTTVHVDKVLMGTIALRQLLDRATDPTRPPLKTLVTTRLVVRSSVRAV